MDQLYHFERPGKIKNKLRESPKVFVLGRSVDIVKYIQSFRNPYTKVTGCLCVCVSVPKDLANH